MRSIVNRADRNLLISVGIIIVIFVGGYASLVAYTGFTSPFSIVMSQSMQHDPDQSEIGSIDTGDIVIVMDPSKAEIQSYVDGTKSGYESFGDYGSVIIYDRGSNYNPVIHRAIVWLDYNPGTDTWSAPSLDGYAGTWYYEDETGQRVQNPDPYNITGTLVFEDITVSGKDVEINVDSLNKHSGYLTMGDNTRNNYFDQVSIPGVQHDLVSMDDIRSVPFLEIPWLGTLKILISSGGENLEYVTNSLPSLIMCIIVIFGFLMLLDGLTLYRNQKGLIYRISRVRECSR